MARAHIVGREPTLGEQGSDLQPRHSALTARSPRRLDGGLQGLEHTRTVLCRGWAILGMGVITWASACASTPTVSRSAAAITVYPVPDPNGALGGITAGPDGNVWFTDHELVKVTSSGTFTEYSVPEPAGGGDAITVGPDRNFWITAGAWLVKMTPSGAFTEYKVPLQFPNHIVAGPDGNLWMTDRGAVAKVSLSGALTRYADSEAGMSGPIALPGGITAGPDGNIWFTETAAGAVAKVTPSGVITEYHVPRPAGSPRQITAGRDGNLWFVDTGSTLGGPPQVVRLSTSGTFTEYPMPLDGQFMDFPLGMTVGPDGDLWITMQSQDEVVRMSTAGVFAEFTFPAFPVGNGTIFGGDITAGPDGNLWMTVANDVVKIAPPRH